MSTERHGVWSRHNGKDVSEWWMRVGHRERLLLWLLLASALAFFAYRVFAGLHALEFPDETEKFVAARLIAQGRHLYRDIFGHHGPLAYLLAHSYLAITGDRFFAYARVVPAILAAGAAIAIWNSPVMATFRERVFAVCGYLGLISTGWTMHTLGMLTYQGIAGFLVTVALAQYVLPLLLGRTVSRMNAYAGGTALALVGIAAYPYALAIVLFMASAFAATLRTRPLMARALAAGATSAIGGVAIWLLAFGDILGYAIYHGYFNHVVYSQFIELGMSKPFEALVPGLSAAELIHSGAAILFGAVIILLGAMSQGRARSILAVVLFGVGVIALNPRGRFDFQGATFVIAAIAAFSVILASLAHRNPRVALAVAGILVASTAGLEIASRHAVTGYRNLAWGEVTERRYGPEADDPVAREIRRITTEGDSVEVFVFTPKIFLNADRLPATGQISYLPWQAAYNAAPVGGYRFDVCGTIRAKRPRAIYFDDRLIWGKHLMSQYEACILVVLREMYSPHGSTPSLFVRNG